MANHKGRASNRALMQYTADPMAEARFLLSQGRDADAQGVLAKAMAAGLSGAPVHSLMGLILHQLGDCKGCERELRQAVQLAPGDGAAQFAHASILYRLGDEAGAEAATRRAIAGGRDDVHSQILLGRICNRQGRFVEAEAAWRAAVRHDPASAPAQRELAHLIWMRTGDIASARAGLDAAPQTPEIVTIAVRLLQDAGEESTAYALATARADRDPRLGVLAARAGLTIDPQAADRRLSATPRNVGSGLRAYVEIEIDLALGRIEPAVRRSEALVAAHPGDSHATALLAVAWRLAGDPRYRALHDYARLVKTYRIAPPDGWNSLEAYLDDLGGALDRIHGPLTHPVGQSLRHGSQTTRSLSDYADPAIRALFQAIDPPIRRHLAAIGAPDQPYDIAGAWSVRLNPGGFHINHIHPQGWVSSAFYVRTLRDSAGDEGKLKFGEPGPPTAPPLPPDHLVTPEPGMLVLFPSYMWHGTVPFSAQDKRLSCAFDIVRRTSSRTAN